MKIKSIKSVDLKGKRVIIRTDFNVPIKNGKVLDDFRIVEQLDTLRLLIENKCRIVIIAHLGQPKPEDIGNEKFSLEPIADRLSHLLDQKVEYIRDVIGFKSSTAVANLKSGEIIMLDNIRFDKGELKDSKQFAKKLAKYGDLYINEAFSVSHRAQASVGAIKKYLPSYAGLHLEKEVAELTKSFTSQKPLVAILGGAKLDTKIPLIKTMNKKADHILIGGALANDFLAAAGLEVGKSLVDTEGIYFIKKHTFKKVLLPVDVVVSTEKEGGKAMVKSVNNVGKNDYIFDIGPETLKLYAHYINKAGTLFWNGPMGFFELKEFKHGTMTIARLVASRSKGKAYGVVGGGETVEALKMTKMIEYVDWVSTGGGAMLSFVGGEKMPGLSGIVK
jgi:phosphoglycerate kinase